MTGDDADGRRTAITWRSERRVRNPDPGAGPVELAASRHRGARRRRRRAALIVLGDQPRLSVDAVTALLASPPTTDRPIVVPVYPDDGGRNPVLLRPSGVRPGRLGDRRPRARSAARGQPGARPGGRRSTGRQPGRRHARGSRRVAGDGLGRARSGEPRAGRSGPRGPRRRGFLRAGHAASSGPIHAGPTSRPSNPCGRSSGQARRGSTSGRARAGTPCRSRRPWLPSGGEVIAVDPSKGMLEALRELAERARGSRTSASSEARWPPDDVAPPSRRRRAHRARRVRHRGDRPVPRGDGDARTSRLCVAILMERQPSSIADVCWPPVHGEARVALPALPEFVELLRALGREPAIERLERETRRFADRGAARGVPAPPALDRARQRRRTTGSWPRSTSRSRSTPRGGSACGISARCPSAS